MNKLENSFHKEMLQIYHQAQKYCNYNTTRFFQMVNEKGGPSTAKDLLSSQEPHSGLTTLWEYGRLDLSMEALVIDPRFEELFRKGEREMARGRLVACGWGGDDI
jgi:hypothetical protein